MKTLNSMAPVLNTAKETLSGMDAKYWRNGKSS